MTSPPRNRLQSPVPTKPHIWRDPQVSLFGQTPPPWCCANLAHSVFKFGARGDTPAAAFDAWRERNRGTGRHG